MVGRVAFTQMVRHTPSVRSDDTPQRFAVSSIGWTSAADVQPIELLRCDEPNLPKFFGDLVRACKVKSKIDF